MRLSRRSRYVVSGGIGVGAAAASYLGLPGFVPLAPIVGLFVGALAFSALTSWVRHSRRERHNRKFE